MTDNIPLLAPIPTDDGPRRAHLRMRIQRRQAAIAREARIDRADTHNRRVFDAVKETLRHELGAAGYADLWRRVYDRHPLIQLRELTPEGRP